MGFLDGAFSFIERFGLLCGIYARHELALSFKGDLHINLLRILDRKELQTCNVVLAILNFRAKIDSFQEFQRFEKWCHKPISRDFRFAFMIKDLRGHL